LETIKRTAFRRCLFLFVGLFLALSLAVYEVVDGALPERGFGFVFLLLIVAFLAGTSLILRATARAVREHLSGPPTTTEPMPAQPSESNAEVAFSGMRNE